MALLGFLDMIYAVAVPVLFWTGVIYGVYRSASSSEPFFLGGGVLAKAFWIVVILFLIGLMHEIFRMPFLLGFRTVEYSLIAAIFSAIFFFASRQEETQRRRDIESDPTIKECKTCGAVVEKIYVVCPKCDKPLDNLTKENQKGGTS